MVRCLDEVGDLGLDETYNIAKEYGLINDNDEFSRNPDNEILYKDFLTILRRFLGTNQYLYVKYMLGDILKSGARERLR